MPNLPPTPRTTLKRLPAQGSHDRDLIHAILDEGLVAHVGFALEGQPYVIPMSYARRGDRLLLHGSAGSRLVRAASAGAPLCVTVTLLDGLVLARSAFNHSVNYRSAVVLGVAEPLAGRAEKREALDAIAEHVLAGRSAAARAPTDAELDQTGVLSLPIAEASAKVRAGPPEDDPADLSHPCWAGVLPLPLAPGAPEPDPRLAPGTPVPEGLLRYRRGR